MINIDLERCIGCGLCVRDCFRKVIGISDQKAFIKDNYCMKCGHCIAVCPNNAISMDDYDMSEVLQYEEGNFAIDSDKLLNLIKYRRSVRHFLKKPIEQEKLLKIIEAGRFTPTGGNAQGVSYIVVQENLTPLKKLALKRLKLMADAILKDDTQPENIKNYAHLWVQMYEDEQNGVKDSLFFEAPVVVLTVANSPLDAALAASNMELMTASLGLGCLFSGFFVRASLNNLEIKKMLGLDTTQKIITCLVMGYPDVHYLRTVPRKKAVISWK